MALSTQDLKEYKNSNLTILELYEKIAQQEQAYLDNKKAAEDILTIYYDSFIGKYVKIKYNATAYSFYFIEHNIFRKQKKLKCIDFYENRVTMEPRDCNYLWLKNECTHTQWEFITEEEFLGYEKQIKDLISLVIKND